MTFRLKLFILFVVALLLSVGLIAAGVTALTRRSFDQILHQRSDAVVAQFERELARRRVDVVHRLQVVADAEATVRMAIDLSRPQADLSAYGNQARVVSPSHQLDFLDFVRSDGGIVSSAEWPARSGAKMDWVTQPVDWAGAGSFLMKVDTPGGPALGLMSVATVRVGDKNLYIAGGERLGKDFLDSVALPAGIRALLYLRMTPAFEPANLISQSGPVDQAERFAPFIEQESQQASEERFEISWTGNPASVEEFHALPLLGRQKELLGVVLVGSSRQGIASLDRRIRSLAAGVMAAGVFLGLLLSWWGAAAVTRPVRKLVAATTEFASGDWNARASVRGRGEIGRLAQSFNRMTAQLIERRERLLQAERVAAWREIARRFAHELSNPIFPLQTTLEDLQRAKEQNSSQFDEIFRESTGTMLSEVNKLSAIAGRFSDFAAMPRPELAPVNLNDVVRGVLKAFEPQFSAVGRPPVTPEVHLDEDLPVIQADSALLHRAIENLVLNAMDAMPAGGVLMLRTARQPDGVHLEVSDTGSGLTPEECQRFFTPYHTAKRHSSGLGLAIVQSVVSDHGGRVSVESEAGVGTSVHIDLPLQPPPLPSCPPAEPKSETV